MHQRLEPNSIGGSIKYCVPVVDALRLVDPLAFPRPEALNTPWLLMFRLHWGYESDIDGMLSVS